MSLNKVTKTVFSERTFSQFHFIARSRKELSCRKNFQLCSEHGKKFFRFSFSWWEICWENNKNNITPRAIFVRTHSAAKTCNFEGFNTAMYANAPRQFLFFVCLFSGFSVAIEDYIVNHDQKSKAFVVKTFTTCDDSSRHECFVTTRTTASLNRWIEGHKHGMSWECRGLWFKNWN